MTGATATSWVEHRRVLGSRCAAYESPDRTRFIHSWYVRPAGGYTGGRWHHRAGEAWTLRPTKAHGPTFRRFTRTSDGVRDITGWGRDPVRWAANLAFDAPDAVVDDAAAELWGLTRRLYARNDVPMPDWVDPNITDGTEVGWAVRVLAFPFAGRRPCHLHDVGIAGLGTAFRQHTASGFVRAGFGARHVRRDVVRATGAAPASVLVAVAKGARFLDTDTVADVLAHWNEHLPDWQESHSMTASWLAALAQQIGYGIDRNRRRLLLSFDPTNRVHVDTLYLLDGPGTQDQMVAARNWNDLHDRLIRTRRAAANAYAEQLSAIPIVQDAVYAALDGARLPGGARLVSVKRAGELDDWSDQMGNCIRGYQSAAINHFEYFFAVYGARDRMIGNLAITGGFEVVELAGKHNRAVSKQLRTSILQQLTSARKRRPGVEVPQPRAAA
ncbi:hypothetical protein [Agromyces sp. NPDC058126]|uniref:hypothetical protein n=1 Tax=Agromyces sp. NPDC058126 TaxID=3346350 RepID=UPI0036D8B844